MKKKDWEARYDPERYEGYRDPETGFISRTHVDDLKVPLPGETIYTWGGDGWYEDHKVTEEEYRRERARAEEELRNPSWREDTDQ